MTPSDTEITRRCAEAMGIKVVTCGVQGCMSWRVDDGARKGHYDPLHDDAQAMALVKKFYLSINIPHWKSPGTWHVMNDHGKYPETRTCNDDLNRAICECVYRMIEKATAG